MSIARPKKVRLADIADLAGVSVSTASRVLAEAPGISSEVRRNVFDVAGRLGYGRPHHAVAQAGALRRVHLYSRLDDLGALAGRFPAEVLNGIREECERRGLPLICAPAPAPPFSDTVLAPLTREPGSAIILLSIVEPEVVAAFQQTGLPVVLLNIDAPDLPLDAVLPDNEQAPMQLARRVAAEGHTRVVVLRSVTRRTILTRIERFSHAFQAAAGEAASITVLDTPLRASVTELKQTLATALAETDATAIFGCVDLLAVGALGALADLGLRAPTDISVVGFDDLPVSALTTPPLTTVCIDRARLGAYAVRQAAARADDPAAPPLRLVLGCPLVERGSLGPVPVTPPSRKIAQ